MPVIQLGPLPAVPSPTPSPWAQLLNEISKGFSQVNDPNYQLQQEQIKAKLQELKLGPLNTALQALQIGQANAPLGSTQYGPLLDAVIKKILAATGMPDLGGAGGGSIPVPGAPTPQGQAAPAGTTAGAASNVQANPEVQQATKFFGKVPNAAEFKWWRENVFVPRSTALREFQTRRQAILDKATTKNFSHDQMIAAIQGYNNDVVNAGLPEAQITPEQAQGAMSSLDNTYLTDVYIPKATAHLKILEDQLKHDEDNLVAAKDDPAEARIALAKVAQDVQQYNQYLQTASTASLSGRQVPVNLPYEPKNLDAELRSMFATKGALSHAHEITMENYAAQRNAIAQENLQLRRAANARAERNAHVKADPKFTAYQKALDAVDKAQAAVDAAQAAAHAAPEDSKAKAAYEHALKLLDQARRYRDIKGKEMGAAPNLGSAGGAGATPPATGGSGDGLDEFFNP